MAQSKVDQDAQTIVAAMRDGGRDAAAAKFAELSKGLKQFEAIVLQDKAQAALRAAGLL